MNCSNLLSLKVFKSALLVAAFFCGGTQLLAQPWVNESDSLKNFYDIQRNFNEYWQGRTIEKGTGWKQFKRWEHFWEQRVGPTGEFPNPMQLLLERPVLKDRKRDLLLGAPQNPWSPMGPSNAYNAEGGENGLGRINCVVTHPTDTNIIWVGSSGGGAWKSTNGGSSWSTATDLLPTLGVGDIAIDPKNPDIMYLATGDTWQNVFIAYSVGVLKSLDGGATWNPTGLNYNSTQTVSMYRMLINPDSTNILIVAANNGIFRSVNSGATWTKTLTGIYKDLEFKPGDASVVYAGRTNGVYRSIDGGTIWKQITTGLPTANVGRVSIAVTPAEPEIAYALYSNTAGGYLGLYISYDSGETWELASDKPNILHLSPDGIGTGGQGYYDLALAVSPVDPGDVYVGGINIWRSLDFGQTWIKSAHWYKYKEVPTVHADQHTLYFDPNSSRLFVGNDGGIYKSGDGIKWSWIGDGLQITQFYRLGTSATNPDKVIAGAQDNRTLLYNGSTWKQVYGGDGMEAVIDPNNENNMYACSQNGNLSKSVDGGKTFSSFRPTSDEGAWVTPYMLNPQNSNSMYIGYVNVWKNSKNSSWTQISKFTGNNNLNILKVAPSDSNTIYVSTGFGNIRRTTDGGVNWTIIPMPAQTVLTSLAIHPSDPQKLWATFSGYTAGKKVYTSADGGTTWTNISKNLPNIPANTIIYQNDSPDRLYVGTDVGVYHIDKNLAEWISFNQDLPNVIISELEIQYSAGKLRAATFGRGIWQADIILGTVGVEDEGIKVNSPVVIMPNPAQNYISIQCPAQSFEKVLLKLVDVQGKEIFKTEMTAGENLLKGEIDLHSVANGTYFLNIQTALKTYTVKVSVSR